MRAAASAGSSGAAGAATDASGRPTRGAPAQSPWLFDRQTVENAPSRSWFLQRANGDEVQARKKEEEYRIGSCQFIQDSGRALRMPQLTIATALVFYHRFYAFKSYEHHERFVLSTTALFLASKVEETPRKLKDVVGEALKNWNKHVKDYRVPEPESREVHELKEKVLVTERILLQTIGFDLSIEHPYRPLLAYVKSITGTRDLAQIAWNFINDSYRTTACLQYSPRFVAAAALTLAADRLTRQGKAVQLPNLHKSFEVHEDGVHATMRLLRVIYDDKRKGGGGESGAANAAAAAKAEAPAAVKTEAPAAAAAPAATAPAAAPAAAHARTEQAAAPAEPRQAGRQPVEAGGGAAAAVKTEAPAAAPAVANGAVGEKRPYAHLVS
mmetsp:Transcript_9038/g.29868  ORF Transcript_9038/g.29868 Transcript_9038/m.29868 type:complete len:384 (+) Transcript_9038:32-1183(+)